MKVEVGDWVRFRGGTRIYEVFAVHEGQHRNYVTVIGASMQKPVDSIQEVAPKFWIKKAGDE